MFNLAHFKKKIDQVPVDKKFGYSQLMFSALRNKISKLPFGPGERKVLFSFISEREAIWRRNYNLKLKKGISKNKNDNEKDKLRRERRRVMRQKSRWYFK